MNENQSSVIQIVYFVFCVWFAKETLASILKSLLGVNGKLSDTEKVRARVLARFKKNNIK